MKIYSFVLLAIFIPMHAMYFDIEEQQYYVIERKKTATDHVVIDIPYKECALCLEKKYLTGSVPCSEGDKHPDVCDDCVHKIIETEHVSKGHCPFCRSKLTQSYRCSICKEKFKNIPSCTDIGCFAYFIRLFKAIYSLL